MTYQRKMSTIERYYVSCDSSNMDDHTPCVNQIVIQCHGQIDVKELSAAIAKASIANPGSRLKLERHLGFSRWVDSGHSVSLRTVDTNDWDGYSNKGSYFLNECLPPRLGLTIDVVLVNPKRERSYLIFRSHHGVMDGRGTQHFANDVFRILNGKPPIGENNQCNDVELAKRISRNRKQGEMTEEVSPPTGNKAIVDNNDPSRWVRRTLTGKHKSLLGKVALEIAKYARMQGVSDVRFQLPVDMRPRVDELNSTANLTGGIVVDVPEDGSIDDWNSNIKQQIDDKREAEIPRFLKIFPFHLLNWVPLSVMKQSTDRLVKKRRRENKFRTTGIISNLGRISLEDFSGAGMIADSIFFIPPEFETTALFVTMTGHDNGIEILMRMPGYLDGGKLDQLLNHVVDSLEARVEYQQAG